MNEETLQDIQKQIALLPKKVRDVISTINITSEIANLQKKHGLMLDQVSTLELETMLVMIGLESAEDFVNNLKSNLNVKEELAAAIANDINELIFDKIRRVMMDNSEKDTQITEERLDKDSILQEIENPTPTFKPSTEKAEAKDILPEIAPTQVLTEYTPSTLPKKSIIEQKLTEPTRIPPKEIELSIRKIPQTQITPETLQKKYTTDPYKEPIV